MASDDASPNGTNLTDAELARALDLLPDGVVLLDAGIRVVWVNAQYTAMTGWQSHEVVGRSGLDMLDPGQLAEAIEALSIVREAPQLLAPGAYRLSRRDGGFVSLELHAAPLDPADPDSLTALMVRPVEYQNVITEGIEMLNADGPILDMASFIVHRIGWSGGTMAIAFDDDSNGLRRSVHPGLPAVLDGTCSPPDGRAPWDELLATGKPAEVAVADLPLTLREAAEACGFVACTVDAVPDPGGRDALILLWLRDDASSTYRFLFHEEPRYLLLRLALERRHYQRALRRAATRDHLTGLANRARFFEALHAAEPRCSAVLYIDLDDFKPINDTYGHATGDAVLAEIGRRLLGVIGSDDIAARVGGDEFAVFCPTPATTAAAEDLAEAVHRSLTAPIDLPAATVKVGATIGIATSLGGDTPPPRLIEVADTMLYEHKRGGKDGWRRSDLP